MNKRINISVLIIWMLFITVIQLQSQNHPIKKSYTTGKVFWQCLNAANWLVYTSQVYDCIHNWLSEEERILLEKDFFIPYAEFLSVENPQFFNRIYNNSTCVESNGE